MKRGPLLGLLFGLFTLWPLLVYHGIPAYQHDWSWAFESIRFRDGLLQLVSTWNEEGLGHANPFATANPVSILTVASGAVFPAKAALLLVLAAICAAAGGGVFASARYLTRDNFAAALAALLYVASPVFFNKTSAGQIAYLEAYALFPWTVLFTVRAIREGAVADFAALAICAGLECVQPQFFLFGVLQAALFAAVFRSRRSLAALMAVAAAELLLNLPQVFALLTLQNGYAFTVPHPVARWEFLQSADPAQALRLLGYIIPYAANTYARMPGGGVALLLMWVLPLLAAIGLMRKLRDAAAQGVLLMLCAGLLLATGVRGPLRPVLDWSFVHIAATTLLREFYHSAALVACAFALGAAYCVAQADRRISAAVFAVCTAALLPLAMAGHDRDLNFVQMNSGQQRASAFIRTLPPGRVLPFPYKMPVQLGGAPVSGVDVFPYVDRAHMLAGEYGSTPEIDAAAAMLADGRAKQARNMFERYGIRYIVWRSYARSAFPDSLLEASQRPYRARAERVFNGALPLYLSITRDVHCFADTCVGTIDAARQLLDAGTDMITGKVAWPSVSAEATLVQAPPLANVSLPQWNLSPLQGWVAAAGWAWADPRIDDLIEPAAVNASHAAADLRFAASQSGISAYVGGPVTRCAVSCARLPYAGAPRAFPANAAPLHVKSFTAVSVPHVPNVLPKFRSPAFVGRADNVVPWRVNGRLNGAGLVLVVMRTRIDREWAFNGLPVVRRVSVDGGLNGWIVDAGTRGGPFTISYEPERNFLIAAVVELACYLSLMAAGVSRIRRSRL